MPVPKSLKEKVVNYYNKALKTNKFKDSDGAFNAFKNQIMNENNLEYFKAQDKINNNRDLQNEESKKYIENYKALAIVEYLLASHYGGKMAMINTQKMRGEMSFHLGIDQDMLGELVEAIDTLEPTKDADEKDELDDFLSDKEVKIEKEEEKPEIEVEEKEEKVSKKEERHVNPEEIEEFEGFLDMDTDFQVSYHCEQRFDKTMDKFLEGKGKMGFLEAITSKLGETSREVKDAEEQFDTIEGNQHFFNENDKQNSKYDMLNKQAEEKTNYIGAYAMIKEKYDQRGFFSKIFSREVREERKAIIIICDKLKDKYNVNIDSLEESVEQIKEQRKEKENNKIEKNNDAEPVRKKFDDEEAKKLAQALENGAKLKVTNRVENKEKNLEVANTKE